MMGLYRRTNFAIAAFRNLTTKIPPRTATPQKPTSRTLQFLIEDMPKIPIFPRYSPISQRFGSQSPFHSSRHPFLVGANRFYYVDRHRIQHFKPRGPRRWIDNPRNVLIVVLVGSGVAISVYFGNSETIPYTKRSHFVLLSRAMERRLGETQFDQLKASFKGKILPAIHPESIRVRLIAKDIIEALQRGLRHEQVR